MMMNLMMIMVMVMVIIVMVMIMIVIVLVVGTKALVVGNGYCLSSVGGAGQFGKKTVMMMMIMVMSVMIMMITKMIVGTQALVVGTVGGGVGRSGTKTESGLRHHQQWTSWSCRGNNSCDSCHHHYHFVLLTE